MGPDSVFWYLDGSYEETGQMMTATLPVGILGRQEYSTDAELASFNTKDKIVITPGDVVRKVFDSLVLLNANS